MATTYQCDGVSLGCDSVYGTRQKLEAGLFGSISEAGWTSMVP